VGFRRRTNLPTGDRHTGTGTWQHFEYLEVAGAWYGADITTDAAITHVSGLSCGVDTGVAGDLRPGQPHLYAAMQQIIPICRPGIRITDIDVLATARRANAAVQGDPATGQLKIHRVMTIAVSLFASIDRLGQAIWSEHRPRRCGHQKTVSHTLPGLAN